MVVTRESSFVLLKQMLKSKFLTSNDRTKPKTIHLSLPKIKMSIICFNDSCIQSYTKAIQIINYLPYELTYLSDAGKL